MSRLGHKIKVAMSDGFLDALNDLSKTPRTRTLKFVQKFRANPASPGLNYETIENAADSKMRSVRVDQSYRAIVLKPEQGNVYVLLYVAHHDDAYRWAENKKVTIHPKTGSLQVLPAQYVEPVSEVEDDEEPEGLVDHVRDRELLAIGVPEELVGLIRSLKTLGDLERAQEQLPDEVYEAIFFLAEGESVQDVDRALRLSGEDEEDVDTEDYAAALDRPISKRRFVTPKDDEEWEQILNAPLEKWRTFLHQTQHELVYRDWNGPVRALGGAGTGKTVAAMHRAAYLAAEVFTGSDDRILFTTFTRNLAADIGENLRYLCKAEEMRRVEVVHIDKWVRDFLQKHGYPHTIKYWQHGKGELWELWQNAMIHRPDGVDLPESFYREEWDHVIQDEGVTTLREYFRVRRTGRGTPLHRRTRKEVWPVFEEYRNLLAENDIREKMDAMRDARQILEEKGDILPYRSVVVDEAQDLPAEAFKLIRQMIPEEQENDLFIVGDAHQRIYRHRVVMSRCGIEIRGRAHKLRINYRTTDEIRKFAVNVLEDVDIDDLDGGEDTQWDYKSLRHGDPPTVIRCDSFAEEVDAIVAYVDGIRAEAAGDEDNPLASVCLVARTQKLVEKYESAMQKNGVDTYRISRDKFDDRRQPGLRVATMHRVKGLEFDRVIVAGVNDGVVPLRIAIVSTDDEAVREEAETRERALFYVAVTRARNEALVTGSGRPSPLLPRA